MSKESVELFTAARLAKIYGVTPSEIKKAIKDSKVKADAIKRGCSYYSKATIEKIKKALPKMN